MGTLKLLKFSERLFEKLYFYRPIVSKVLCVHGVKFIMPKVYALECSTCYIALLAFFL